MDGALGCFGFHSSISFTFSSLESSIKKNNEIREDCQVTDDKEDY